MTTSYANLIECQAEQGRIRALLDACEARLAAAEAERDAAEAALAGAMATAKALAEDRDKAVARSNFFEAEALRCGQQNATLAVERDAAPQRAREARETAENYLGHCDAACKQLEAVEAERDNALRYTELLIAERHAARGVK